MGTSCSDLSRYSGAPCKLYMCVESIVGLASNSASPTDTWIIKFRPGTNYEKKPVLRGFMKIFLSTRDLTTASFSYMMLLNGLAYEIKIYRDIIRPLVDHQISPNFVKYLGSATDCSYEDMSRFLGKAVPTANLLRNIYYIRNELGGRPSITDPTPDPAKSVALLEAQSLRYDFLITEPTGPSPYQTLSKYMGSLDPGTFDIDEVFKMYFQIVVACYALSLSTTSHNDLHAGNIFLETYADSQGGNLINYVVNDVYFPLNIKYICRIYDFDRTYSGIVGKNLLLTGADARNSSQENKFYPSKDILKISGYILRSYSGRPDVVKMVKETVTNGGAHWAELYGMWVTSKNLFLQGQLPGGAMFSLGPDFYARFPGPEQMLENLAGQMRARGLFAAPGPVRMGDTYILSKGMFEDGHLNLSTVAFDRNQLQEEKGKLQEQVRDCQARLAESQARGQSAETQRDECLKERDLSKGKIQLADVQYKDLLERKEQYREALGNCQRQLRRGRLAEARRDEPALEDWEMI